jgi:hypothetical protein
MTPRVFRAIGSSVVCVLLGAAAVAAQRSDPLPGTAGATGTTSSARAGDVGARSTSILGGAWNADNSPIPHARLRLRNVLTGRIEASAVANEKGEFAFTGVEGGSYVIELVSEGGKVLTLGQTFTVAAGETVATFVRLGTTARWFDGFFKSAAAAASSTAASAGVTAIAPDEMRPVSAQR